MFEKSGTPMSDKKSNFQFEIQGVHTVGPLTVMQHGNSDPFSSLAIPVTAQTNRVMTFFRDVYLPATYATKAPIHYRALGRNGQWTDALAALHHSSCAHAFMSAFLTVMARLSPPDALQNEVLHSKAQSYNFLRRQIQQDLDYKDKRVILNSVIYLYAAETFAGNYSEASIHGEFLRLYFQGEMYREGSMSISYSTIARALVYDLVFAQLRMTRPIYSLDIWVRELSDDLLTNVCCHLQIPSRSFFSTNLEPGVSWRPVEEALEQIKFVGWLWNQDRSNDSVTENAFLVAQWIIIQTQIMKAELISQFLMLQKVINQRNSLLVLSPERDGSLVTQCCMILAIQCFLTWLGTDPIISGRPVLGVCRTLLLHLDSLLSQFLGYSTVLGGMDFQFSRICRYQDAYLWIFYVGAQCEQRDPELSYAQFTASFNVRFCHLSRYMGLSEWSVIKENLSRFLYFDAIQPDASSWIPASLALFGGMDLVDGKHFPKKVGT